ncbi:PREDICTED: vomeronasal type-1 receptor 1-like [Dipodomys ordii]|uniref:Vomeronasal type-1 receptor n=1 Tax=Dipodomys ordii TaxID=10020 RepID=A0A1S3G509_DIPOR|nr:PREDICTED: vomeronasal type-1 receptor 1-like [Dipodomys ordii]
MEMGVGFLTQTAAGILGNSSLFSFHSYTLLTGQQMKPTDPIHHHLVFANNLVVLSRGIPQTMAGLGWKYFLDEAGCKVVLYFHRVARGVSLNATCLLSGFQVALFSSIDVMCLLFMMWASGSMVLVLHRHKEMFWHIHSPISSQRPSHQARATSTILALVSMFVFFYCLSAIFTV